MNMLQHRVKMLFCAVLLCCAGFQYRAAATDFATFQQSLAKETPGSDQWKKLHKEFCNDAKKFQEQNVLEFGRLIRRRRPSPQLEPAIEFYKSELKKDITPEVRKCLAEWLISLLEVKAESLVDRCKFSEAKQLYREIVEFSEKVLGGEHVTTSSLYETYATFLCHHAGNAEGYKEAVKIALITSEKYKKLYGEKHYKTAKIYGVLANSCRSLWHYKLKQTEEDYYKQLAEKYYTMQLIVYEELKDAALKELAISCADFGDYYRAIHDYARAEKYFLRALDVFESILDSKAGSSEIDISWINKHYITDDTTPGIDISGILERLIRLYGGDSNKVLACYDRTLKIPEKALKRRVKQTDRERAVSGYARLLRGKAEFLASQSKNSEADRAYQEAIEFAEKELGEDHSISRFQHKLYAGFCSPSERFKMAEKYYFSVLERDTKKYGERHWKTGMTYGYLAALYGKQKNIGQEEKYYKLQLDAYENSPGMPQKIIFDYIQIQTFYFSTKKDYNAARDVLLRFMKKMAPCTGADRDRFIQVLTVIFEVEAKCLASKTEIQESEKFLQEGLKICEDNFGKKHGLTGQFYDIFAAFCHDIGDYERSIKYYQSSLPILQEKYGKNSKRTAMAYGNLAKLYMELGDYEQADKYFKSESSIYESLPDIRPKEIAEIYSDIGNFYLLKGDFIKSEHFLLKSWEPYKNDHISQLQGSSARGYVLHRLGRLYKAKADYSKAITFYNRALAVRTKYYGDDSKPSNIIQTQNELADVFFITGQYRQAEKLYLAALATARKAYGEVHVTVGEIYKNLGKLRRIQGKYDDALSYYRKSLAIFEEKLGKDHIDVAKVLNNIGNIYKDLANYAEAEKYLLRSIAINKQKLGGHHPNVGVNCNNLAEICISRGQHERAEEFLQNALDIFYRCYGGKHNLVAYSYSLKSNLAKEQKDYQNTLEYAEKAYQIYLDLFGMGHTSTAGALCQIGSAFVAMNNIPAAEEKMTQALKIYRNLFPEGHIGTAKTLLELGKLYRLSGRKDVAVSTLLDALNMFEKFFKPSHPKVEETCLLLGELYTEMKDPVNARKYFQKANSETVSQKDIYDDLSGQQSEDVAQKVPEYAEMLRRQLSLSAEPEVKKMMTELYQKSVNVPDFSDKLVEKFDTLEEELRQKKQIQEQILFLKGFSETGFSDLFPEARKNYFSNLEDTIDEEKLSVEKQLMALTVLASDYLRRNDTFFRDGKACSAEAIEKAKESKRFPTALKLYRITLRRLLQFNNKDFGSIRQDAEKTAQSCSDAEYQTVFKALDQLHRLKAGNGKTAIAELQKLAVSHPAAVSAEIISFIEYDPAILNREDIDVVRLLSCVSADAIASAQPMLRRRIASVLLNKNQEKEAEKWFSSVTSSIDRMLYLNTLASGTDLLQLSANLKQLESLKPDAFELNGKKYTADDMRLLLQLTRCKYAKSLSDDSLLLNSARQVEEMLNNGKCSKDFTALLQAESLTVLFDYNYLLGDFQQAKSQIEKLLEKGFDPVSRAQYLVRHGMCCMALGENQNAAKSLREAGEILRESKYKDQAIVCYRNLACAEYRAGNYSEALTAMRNCAAVNSITDHKEDTSVTEAILIVELAALYHSTELGRKGKEEEFKRLRLRAERMTQPGNIADFALAEAMFRRDIVRRPKMEEQIQALERYFNYTRSTAPESLLRSPLFLPMRESEAQKMLLKTLKKTGDVGKLDFWNKKFEQGRVRSLTVSADSAHDGVKAEEFADMSMLEIIAQCSDARAIVETEKSKPQDQRDEKLIQAATSTLRRLENDFETKKMRLAKAKAAKFNALMADNFVIHPDSMNQLATVLPADTACLQFVPVDDEIIVYIISRNAPPIMHQIDLKKHQKNAKSFFNQIRKLRMLLQRAGSNERVQRELNAVYKIVFADLEAPLAKMQTKKLLVNSSGILRYIPFAALYDGKNFLVEKYQVTNATGLDLVRLSRSAVKRQYEKTNIAVFADPDGSLPSGRKEGGIVAEFFPQRQVFTGHDASLAKLESLTGSVNFIHLATHGVIDSTMPRNSYIMMANGRNWRYCDMMGFNVENVDSIVLSACNSAMSENCAGGEIEGMAYQLLKKSPSGSVVASFWKVDDMATSKLMTAYYSHIAKSLKTSQTLDRGGALRAAQLELLKSPETRNPYYWAAFTLFGDCR